MADNVLGSISIVITGDTTQLNAALNSAVQGAQNAGASISAAMNQSAAGTQQIIQAIGMLAGVIERESAAATLATQRNLAMAGAFNTAAVSAQKLGQSAQQGGFGLRYMVFGLKDIVEGRGAYALAEIVNVLTRLGPAALVAGGVVAVIGGSIYAFTELANKIQDAKDKSEDAFGSITRGLHLANDELDVSNEKLKNQIALLQGTPVNRAAEAMDEIRVEADKATDALHGTLDALQKALSDNSIGLLKGIFTNQAPTGKIADLAKNFSRESSGIERQRQSALNQPGLTAEGARGVNADFDKQLADKVKYYSEAAKQVVKGVAEVEEAAYSSLGTGKSDLSVLQQQAADFAQSLELAQQRRSKAEDELANKQKLQGLEDAKRGAEQVRSLAVAQIEAQQKALEDQRALQKHADEARIQSSHAVVEVEIAGLFDRRNASIATAEEELRVAKQKAAAITEDQAQNTAKQIALIRAKGAAESQGKTGTEAQTIGVKTGQSIASLQTKQQEDLAAATLAVAEAQARLNVAKADVSRENEADREKGFVKQLDQEYEAEERIIQVAREIQEIRDKAAGQQAELKATGDKLALERQYGEQIGHTYQQEINYLTQIAAIEERARQAKIAGLQKDLANAVTGSKDPNVTQGDRDEQAKRAATLQGQVAELQQQSANANYEAQTKILDQIQKQNAGLQAQKTLIDALISWQQITVGTAANQFAQALVSLPQKVGDSLADSIFKAPKRGQSKIGEIGEGLVKTGESVGKDLAGKLITDAIQKLIATLIPQAAIASLQNAALAANTAAATALAAATVAATATQVPAMVALTAAIGLLIPALYVDAGASLFGFATGGPVPHDMIAQVHGGEYVLNKDQVSGRAPLPSQFQTGGLTALGNMPLPSRLSLPGASTSSSSSASVSIGQMHVHGIQNGRQFAEEMVRQIPRVLKARGPQWSPYSS